MQILFNDNGEVQQNLNYPSLTTVSHLTPFGFCFSFAVIRDQSCLLTWLVHPSEPIRC